MSCIIKRKQLKYVSLIEDIIGYLYTGQMLLLQKIIEMDNDGNIK